MFDKLFKKTTKVQSEKNIKSAIDTENAARNIIEKQNQKYQDIANGMKRMKPVSDDELIKYFAEYFAPNKEFFSAPDSPKYQAYFNAVNAAKLEMLNQPVLYREATGRMADDLMSSVNNPTPGITNMLICGQIYCMGKYAVIKDHLFCVDFVEQLPNCIALYLLLIAQKEPTEKRTQILDTGDEADSIQLKTVIESLKVLDPTWQPKIF